MLACWKKTEKSCFKKNDADVQRVDKVSGHMFLFGIERLLKENCLLFKKVGASKAVSESAFSHHKTTLCGFSHSVAGKGMKSSCEACCKGNLLGKHVVGTYLRVL